MKDPSFHFLLFFVVSLILVHFCFSEEKVQCGKGNKVVVVENELDSKIVQFIWIAPDYQFAFIRTQNRHLWRSTNGGRSWVDQNSLLPGALTPQPPLDRNGIKAWRTTSNPSTLYFYGDQNLWVTLNAGRTYKNYSVPGDYLYSIHVHPSKPDWLYAEVRTRGCFFVGSGDCSNQLLFSSNYGETWKQIQSYFFQVTWGNAGLQGKNGVVPEKTTWILDWKEKSGSIFSKSRDDLELRHTVDLFKTVETVRKDTIFLLHYHNNTFLAEKDSKTRLSLWVSEDDGNTFNKAKFPAHELGVEDQYTILDDTDGAIFINVRHGKRDWGNLYSSSRLGSDYELSLEYNRRERNHVDFLRIQGLDGIYIANQLFENNQKTALVRTMITWDKGGFWRQLSSDSKDRSPLQLHGAHKRSSNDREDFGPIYSNSNAIGLILAVGNDGPSLSDEPDTANTFFSRDAGFTWEKIRNGSNIYEFADHGGIFVLSSSNGPTDRIFYSWNEGKSFENCIFTSQLFEVAIQNIVANPKLSAQSFLLYGYNDETPGYVAHIDFTGLQETKCTEKDYEEWSPFDPKEIHTECLNGKEIKYKRRKRDSKCFNGYEYEVETFVKYCPCKEEDYECDYCYERKGPECVLQDGCEPPHRPSPCEGTYTIPSGYRRIPGDYCSPDLPDKKVKVLSCDSSSNKGGKGSKSGMSGGVIALIVIVILLVIGAALGLVFLYLKKRNMLPTSYRKFRQEDTMIDPDLLMPKNQEED